MSDLPTVLITLGRLPVALETARAMHAAGWRVVIAEPWALHLCRFSRSVSANYRTVSPAVDPKRYRTEIETIARREAANLILPLSEETLHVTQCKERLGATLFSGDFTHTLALHDKLRFVQLAESFDLCVPVTFAESSMTTTNGPLVVKPRFSCSGRGIRFLDTGDVLQLNAGEIAQHRLSGEEYSVQCVAQNGIVRAISCYRSELRDGAVAIAFASSNCASAKEWAIDFVGKIRHTGFIAFDFIVDAQGEAWPIECNPRATSGIHLFSKYALSAALLNTEHTEDGPTAYGQRMEFYSCLTQLVSAIFRRRNVRKTWALMRSHRDVSWSLSDPLPFVLMILLSWPLLWRVLRYRETFAQASVADLEWRPRDA